MTVGWQFTPTQLEERRLAAARWFRAGRLSPPVLQRVSKRVVSSLPYFRRKVGQSLLIVCRRANPAGNPAVGP